MPDHPVATCQDQFPIVSVAFHTYPTVDAVVSCIPPRANTLPTADTQNCCTTPTSELIKLPEPAFTC